MIYAPCVHADLLMRAHGIRYFFPLGGDLGKRRTTDAVPLAETKKQKFDLVAEPFLWGGPETTALAKHGKHGRRPVFGRREQRRRISTKDGTREAQGRKTFDRFPRRTIFIPSVVAFPSNRNAACLWRLRVEAVAPRRNQDVCFSVTRAHTFVSVPEMADSGSTRRGTREQPRTRSGNLSGQIGSRQPRDPPRKFFFPRSANRQARCVRRYVISWQIGRSTDRY